MSLRHLLPLVMLVAVTATAGRTAMASGIPYPGCNAYVSRPKTTSRTMGIVGDSITVYEPFHLRHVEVEVNVTNSNIRNLHIVLRADSPSNLPAKQRMGKKVTLKNPGSGIGSNMSAIFTDSGRPMSEGNLIPLEGIIQPVQNLSFFYTKPVTDSVIAAKGGSQGVWKLYVEDSSPSVVKDPVTLDSWKLVLCPAAPSPVSQNTVQSFDGPAASGDGTMFNMNSFQQSIDSFLNGPSECSMNSTCQETRARFWRSAAALLYLKMKMKGSTDHHAQTRALGLLDQVHRNASQGEKDQVVKSFKGWRDSFNNGPIRKKITSWLDSHQMPSLPGLTLPDPSSVRSRLEERSAQIQNSLDAWKTDAAAKLEGWRTQARSKLDPSSFQEQLQQRSAELRSKLDGMTGNLRNMFNPDQIAAKIDQRAAEITSKIDQLRKQKEAGRSALPSLQSAIKEKRDGLRDKIQGLRQKYDWKGMVKNALGDSIKDDNVQEVLRSYGLDGNSMQKYGPIIGALGNSTVDDILANGVNFNFGDGLSLDGPVGTAILGNVLGIEDPEETKALVDGLKQAGFQDLMKEFLNPAR